MSRAARLALDAMRVTGHVEMRLEKHIPMGAGLGGGSPTRRRCCWRCRFWRAGAWMSRGSAELGRNSAATCRFFCSAARRWESDAARSSFRCPTVPPHGLLVAPGIHVPRRGVSRPEPPFDNRIATK